MQENLFDKDHLIAMQMNEGSELEWHMPTASYPDLTGYKQIAVDLETCDPNLTTLGPGWARKEGSSWASPSPLGTSRGTSRSGIRTGTTSIPR
jgi:hypothetical protein